MSYQYLLTGEDGWRCQSLIGEEELDLTQETNVATDFLNKENNSYSPSPRTAGCSIDESIVPNFSENLRKP